MSRAKKARARKRRREVAHRRVTLAKAGVKSVAIVGFAAAVALSRVSYAGHSKKPLRPLAAVPRYVQIVRQNLLKLRPVPTEPQLSAEAEF